MALGLVGALGLVSPSWADAAQGVQGKTDQAETELARKLHTEGDALFKAGDFARAYVAYKSAWALKKHWQLAGNLGLCEARLEQYPSAAEHLELFLREAPEGQYAEGRKEAIKYRDEALEHVGKVRVTVSEAGAEVYMEGRRLGTSPLLGVVYVEPGRPLFDARIGTSMGYAYADVKAKNTTNVVITLKRPENAGGVMGEKGAGEAYWRRSLPVWISGGALTSALVVLGIVLHDEANRKESERIDSAPEAADTCNRNPQTDRCGSLQDAFDKEDNLRLWSNVSIGGAILAAAGTLGYTIYAWEREKKNSKRMGAFVTVTVSPNRMGIGVSGRF